MYRRTFEVACKRCLLLMKYHNNVFTWGKDTNLSMKTTGRQLQTWLGRRAFISLFAFLTRQKIQTCLHVCPQLHSGSISWRNNLNLSFLLLSQPPSLLSVLTQFPASVRIKKDWGENWKFGLESSNPAFCFMNWDIFLLQNLNDSIKAVNGIFHIVKG